MSVLHALRRAYRDPRLYQITILAALTAYGTLFLGFDVTPERALLIFAACLGTQVLGTRLAGLPRLDLRSPLISALSLILLLRTHEPVLAVLGAVITIAGKFLLRARGKHVFNPTNLGIVTLLLLTDRAWVTHGQWGSVAWGAFFMACLGGVVVHRAARSDVTLAFFAFYAAIVFARSWYLNEPFAIPMYRLQNGNFLIFTFFMISDPKTTPDTRAGRILFAAVVAALAAWFRFGLQEPNGAMYALAACSLTVPIIDRLLRGSRYAWPGAPKPAFPTTTHPRRTEPCPVPESLLSPGSASR